MFKLEWVVSIIAETLIQSLDIYVSYISVLSICLHWPWECFCPKRMEGKVDYLTPLKGAGLYFFLQWFGHLQQLQWHAVISWVVQINSLLRLGWPYLAFVLRLRLNSSYQLKRAADRYDMRVWEDSYQKGTALLLLWNSGICITLTTVCNFSPFFPPP